MQGMIGRRGVLGGLLLAGCARDGAVAAEIEAAVDAELRRHPEHYTNGEARAWLVRRDGEERALLWGTIHIPYSDETVLPRPIRARFAESASLTVENLPTPAQARSRQRQQAAALRKADPAALAALDPGTRVAVRTAGVAPDEEVRVSLVGLARLVASRGPRAPSTDLPSLGIVDHNLVGFARSVEIPVRGLEVLEVSPDPVLQDPNGPAAAAALRQMLRQSDAVPELWRSVLGYYGRGEVARVLAALVAWRAAPEDLKHWEPSRVAVLAVRNRAWVEPLEQTFELPGTHFVAFGGGHLLGDEGVVALLRGRGWEVTACLGDRCG